MDESASTSHDRGAVMGVLGVAATGPISPDRLDVPEWAAQGHGGLLFDFGCDCMEHEPGATRRGAPVVSPRLKEGSAHPRTCGRVTVMSVVKINAITVPEDRRESFEERFRSRAGAVEKTPGFERFELLRPQEGTDLYLVYTCWESEEAFQAWHNSQDFNHAHHGGESRAPVASHSQLWSFQVIETARPLTA
jgi:heme oxygenase (mycobilin-producing)